MTFFDFIYMQLRYTDSPHSPVGSHRYERRMYRVYSTHGPTAQVRNKYIARYFGNHRMQSFSTYEQF